MLKSLSPENIKMANDKLGRITVNLLPHNLGGNNGIWDMKNSLIDIKFKDEKTDKLRSIDGLKSTIEHELIHWAQDYMRIALGQKEFGKPSKKIMNPEIIYDPSEKTIADLSGKGINPDSFHALNDNEFYTNLNNEKLYFRNWFDKTINEFKNELKEDELNRIIKNKVKLVHYYADESHFLQRLKKHSIEKWKKAINELYKMII